MSIYSFGHGTAGEVELAALISANGPLAVRVSKQVVAQSRVWAEQEMWRNQQALVEPIFSSSDAKEGATAFAEKRAPVWTGK